MKRIFCIVLTSLASLAVFSQNGFIENNNQFSFKAYNLLKQSNDNFVFSPYSMSSAIAMTSIGARNVTKSEIINTFGFSSNLIDLGTSYYKSQNSESKTKNLYNANSLWLDNTLKLNSYFIDFNSKYFSSAIKQTDFLKNVEESRLEINKWVETNTNNKIKDLLNSSSVDNTTRLVLVNAIYFKDSWKNKFIERNNFESEFQVSNRKKVSTTFMVQNVNTWHYSTKNYAIIDIPYSNNGYSLMIILPKSLKNLKKLEKDLGYDLYRNYLKNKEKKRVKLSIPKFNIESSYDLNKTLIKLGMKSAFGASADFTGITELERLYISKVIHKANININEEGTEAAAATAVTMRKTSTLPGQIDFHIDKPFIYILRNTNNNCIYFMGKIINPNE